jgi:hypothetical protein
MQLGAVQDCSGTAISLHGASAEDVNERGAVSPDRAADFINASYGATDWLPGVTALPAAPREDRSIGLRGALRHCQRFKLGA